MFFSKIGPWRPLWPRSFQTRDWVIVKKTRWVVLVALMCALLFGLQPQAHATSNYDQAVQLTTTAVVGTVSPCTTNPHDVTYTWKSLVGDAQSSAWQRYNQTTRNTYSSSLAAALSSSTGSWGVSQHGTNVIVYWSEQPLSLHFVGTGSAAYAYVQSSPGSTVKHVVLTSRDNYVPYCEVAVGDVNMTRNTLEVSFADQTAKLMFANVSISYPAGYEGAAVPTEPPLPTYVAMGDSYSSGEGNLPYEYGSDTLSNICHRSQEAYPRQVQRALDLGPTAFVACSGAVSDYVINESNQENAELPQAIPVSDETQFVTITIGGNDIGFGDAIRNCLKSVTAQACRDEIATANGKAADPDFLADIEEALSGIKSLGGNDTQVIAIGYPQLYPEYEDISGSCTWGSPTLAPLSDGKISGRTITEDEIDELREVHDILNDVLETAVANTADPDIHFVDPTDAFETHEICGSSSDWLYEVFLHVSTAEIEVGSFHPNNAGQAAYTSVAQDKIEELMD